jgi:predicted dehydrogenase
VGNQADLSRRAFLGTAATGLTFLVVPRHVVGGEGHKPPSDKLHVAAIGAGGKGADDVNGLAGENLVALCDVDEKRAAETFKKLPNARKFKDFRVMLREMDKQIDAVTVSTADHTHAVASMMAVKMGKHCYTQKPLTHSVHEARALAEAARKHKVATVMGIQGHCGEHQRILCEWVWGGVLGPVREVHIWTNRPLWPQGLDVGRPKEKAEVPASLDWNLWLGPAPERPYHPCYHPADWRGWWDFGTGALGDIACHAFDGVFWALRLGQAQTVEIEAQHAGHNGETFPKWSILTYQFPARGDPSTSLGAGMPPVKLVWYDGGKLPERPKGLEKERELGDNGQILVGDKATLFHGRIIPETKMKEMQPGLPPKTLPRAPDIYTEFTRACKGGEPCGANFPDFAGPLTEIVLAGNLALRVKEKIVWDVPNMKCANVPEANRYVHREYRKGWTL